MEITDFFTKNKQGSVSFKSNCNNGWRRKIQYKRTKKQTMAGLNLHHFILKNLNKNMRNVKSFGKQLVNFGLYKIMSSTNSFSRGNSHLMTFTKIYISKIPVKICKLQVENNLIICLGSSWVFFKSFLNQIWNTDFWKLWICIKIYTIFWWNSNDYFKKER